MDRTVSFRTDVRKVEALDALAEAQARDRTYLLNEAIDNYLDLQSYHRKLIEKGIQQADAGQVIPHSEIKRKAEKLRQRK